MNPDKGFISSIVKIEGGFVYPEVKLKCEEINENINDTISTISKKIFYSVYYKKYDCEIEDCLKNINEKPENAIILISKTGNDFFKKISIFLTAFSLLAILFIFLLSKKKFTALYWIGSVFIVDGLPFLLNGIIKEVNLLNFVTKTFFTNFLTVLLIGLLCLVVAVFCSIVYKTSGKSMKELNDEMRKPKKKIKS
jgi:hypothetical protein